MTLPTEESQEQILLEEGSQNEDHYFGRYSQKQSDE